MVMKGLFIVFHGFAGHSGISKKIFAQCEALRRNGLDTELCYIDIAADGTQCRRIGEQVICNFGQGIRAKVIKRLWMEDITRYVRQNGVDFLYIRYDHNASPILNRWLRQIRQAGIRTVLEIPTYPYDAEFAHLPMSYRLQNLFERWFRRSMARNIDRIVTFSDDEQIFGRQTIRISNGIDPETITLKGELHDTSRELHLLTVANIHIWHGFDRVIEGLHNYYRTQRERKVHLHIVGDSFQELIDNYRQRIADYGLGEYIALTGPLSGAALDAQFDWCDMGVGSLGRHRNGITRLKSLKNREYAARGIPFVYSETDADFEQMPYIMKAPADDSPLDIEALLHFYDSIDPAPAPIRATIANTLSWERQMERVADQILKLQNPES